MTDKKVKSVIIKMTDKKAKNVIVKRGYYGGLDCIDSDNFSAHLHDSGHISLSFHGVILNNIKKETSTIKKENGINFKYTEIMAVDKKGRTIEITFYD